MIRNEHTLDKKKVKEMSKEETSNDAPVDSAALKQCPLPLRCFGDKFMRLETSDATAFQFVGIS